MGDSSLRIVNSVLGLRRFTVEELAHNAKVERSTAASWLYRNRRDFDGTSTVAATGVGRPRRVWQLNGEAEARYEDRLARLTPTRLRVEIDGPVPTAVTRLDSLDEAEAYLVIAQNCEDASDRNAALVWAEQWGEAAAKRAVAHGEVGDKVDATVWYRLVRAQLEVNRLRREGEHPIGADDQDTGNLPTQVLEIARRWVIKLETWPIAEDILPLDRLEPPRHPELEAVGTLAALGLLRSVPVARGARGAFARQVHAIPPTVCVDGLQMLDKSLDGPWSTEVGTMFVVICAGIEQHPALLREPRIGQWLDASLSYVEHRDFARGAYLRTRLNTPGARREDIVGLAGIAGLAMDWPTQSVEIAVEPSDMDDACTRAQRSLIEQGLTYYRMVSSAHGAFEAARSGFARFKSAFISGECDEPGVAS